ncbi:MAG: CvpA family protein [Bacteroidales bacterium]|jgi:membrane protein required for colicin V production|nr:CvpA family protein [Bacteroidales bacterium]
MNFLDIIFIIPVCWFGFSGLRKGFIMEIASLLAIVAGIYISYKFSHLVCEWLHLTGSYANATAFVITLIAVMIGIFFLGKALDIFAKKLSLSFFNRLLGLALGFAKALLFCGVIVYLINCFDLVSNETRDNSLSFRWIESLVNLIIA